jgi:2-polyprenyl-6-methoxyphenol hydroxylase-like FAD-dependent oxidoreductase
VRVLIVGGGVAGLTLAARLRQQGRSPTVVERSPKSGDVGYGIGLYPLGSSVLHGLGVYSDFVARGVETRRYEIADHTGEILQGLDMSVVTDNVGPLIMLPRADLIDVLLKACNGLPIRMGTTVEDLEQAEGAVRVRLSGGTREEFDLVVACDGIQSPLRQRVFGDQEVFDTGWTCWTWWGRAGLYPSDLCREYWGRGWFFGVYPVRDRCMFGVGLPNDCVQDVHADSAAVRPIIRQSLADLAGRVESVRIALEDAETLFAWPMSDVRAEEWISGRVALCGDSAAAFLPTAGVGASNAMRAAAALADELSRADGASVPLALELYVKRCQKIVLGNQHDSRAAARYMFVESKTLGWGRDFLTRHYPAGRVIKQIIKSMREPF